MDCEPDEGDFVLFTFDPDTNEIVRRKICDELGGTSGSTRVATCRWVVVKC